MVANGKLKKQINIFKIRMKLAKENGNLEIAGIYAGVINDLQKLMED